MEQGALPGRGRSIASGKMLRRLLFLGACLSALAMVGAARAGQAEIVTLAAGAFACAALAVALVFSWQALHWPPSTRSPLMPAFVALLQSSSLAAICYLWGALAMQGVYLTAITGLKWQHGWQYALAMALLAVASAVFAQSLADPLKSGAPTGSERQFRWATALAAAQACVAGIGLVVLIVSGKLFSTRADWAANRVFAGLAVAVFAMSVASMIVQRRLKPALRSG